MIDRETDGRFVVSIPDLGDLAAYGDTDKDAVAHVAELARESVQAVVESGQPVPRQRHYNEMPSFLRSKEIARASMTIGLRAPGPDRAGDGQGDAERDAGSGGRPSLQRWLNENISRSCDKTKLCRRSALA